MKNNKKMNKSRKINFFIIFSVIIFLLGTIIFQSPKQASALALCTDLGSPRIQVDINGQTFTNDGSLTVAPGSTLPFKVYTIAEPSSRNGIRYPGGGDISYPGPNRSGRNYTTNNINGPSTIWVWVDQNCQYPPGVNPDSPTTLTININVQAATQSCDINSFTADNTSPANNTGTTLRYSFNDTFPWNITLLSGTVFPSPNSGNSNSGTISTGNLSTTHTYRLTCGPATRDLTVVPSASSGTPPSPNSLNLSCPLPGTTLTANWNAPQFWNTFSFRANPGANNGTFPSAVRDDNVTGTSASFSSIPGETYYVWVHTRNFTNGAESENIHGNITCASASMFGTLTPQVPTCAISPGQSGCNINFSWNTVHPVATSAVTSPTRNDGSTGSTTVGNGNSGSGAFTIPRGNRSFFLYNNGVLLSQSTVSSSCAGGSTWNGAICVSDSDLIVSGTIIPHSPSCVISAGQSGCNISLSWNTVNAPPGSTSAVTAVGMANVNGNSGSASFTIPYPNRIFYLYNSAEELDRTTGNSTCDPATFWNGTLCAPTPVDGVCGPVHNNCASGTSANPGNGSGTFTWQCIGSNGGTDHTCFELKPCTNGANNPPSCTLSGGTCQNGANNPPLCTTRGGSQCTSGADNPPFCTTKGGSCINGATNPPICTTMGGTCLNDAENPPLCTTIGGVCINGAENPPTCTTLGGICINGAIDPPTCIQFKKAPIFIEE